MAKAASLADLLTQANTMLAKSAGLFAPKKPNAYDPELHTMLQQWESSVPQKADFRDMPSASFSPDVAARLQQYWKLPKKMSPDHLDAIEALLELDDAAPKKKPAPVKSEKSAARGDMARQVERDYNDNGGRLGFYARENRKDAYEPNKPRRWDNEQNLSRVTAASSEEQRRAVKNYAQHIRNLRAQNKKNASAFEFGAKVAFNIPKIDLSSPLAQGGLGGAALGAGLGGLAGLIAPGRDEQGKRKSRLMAALKGALGGGVLGGGAGAAAGHFAPDAVKGLAGRAGGMYDLGRHKILEALGRAPG